MDEARALPSALDPQLVLAERQVAGRGRDGRRWVALSGSFIATYRFEFPLVGISGSQTPPLQPGALSLQVGAICAAQLDPVERGIWIKWPNDLVESGGKKIGGILVDVHWGECAKIFVGIGINLQPIGGETEDHGIERALIGNAGSVAAATGELLTVPACAGRLSSLLWHSLRRQISNKEPANEQWLQGYERRNYLLNREVTVISEGKELRGCVRGISSQGALLVDTDGRTSELLQGHIVQVSEI